MPSSARWAGALTVLGAAVRFATLDVQSYELDEAITVGLVRGSWDGLSQGVADTETNPPLYYVLAWLWAKAFGTGEVGLRSLSAVLGTLTVPAVWAAVRRLASERAALVAAALTALNPFLVWHSQQARSYALAALLAAAGFWLWARALGEPSGRSLAWWAVVSALALGAHYFAGFVVAPEAAVLLWRLRSRAAATAAAGVAAAALALLPLALSQHAQTVPGALERYGGSLPRRLAQLPKQFLVGFEAPAEIALGLVAGALTLGAGALLLAGARERDRAGARLAGGIAAAALALPLVLALGGLDYVNSRNLIVAWPPCATVLGAGFAARRWQPAGTAAAVGLCLAFAVAVAGVAADPKLRRDDWRGAARALGRAQVPRAIVVTPDATEPLEVYLPGAEPPSPTGTPVLEVDLVALAPRTARGSRRPPPATDVPLPPGVRVISRERTQTWTAIRIRLPAPATTRPGPVGRRGSTRAAVLVQRPTQRGNGAVP
jgi:4-amino-4-deoxy-L-arabinose transferase-like glycosyltransferase